MGKNDKNDKKCYENAGSGICLFYEVMAIINGMPNTTVSINDPTTEPLTPDNLLTLKTSSALPPPKVFDAQDVYSRKR